VTPDVSILAVTNRARLRHHLAAQIDRAKRDLQDAGARVEVLLVDDYRGTLTCGQMRNAALQSAEGEWVVWLDDDDVYLHRERALLQEVSTDVDWVGFTSGAYAMDPQALTYDASGWHASAPSPMTSMFRRPAVLQCPPYDDLPVASDTRWRKNMRARIPVERTRFLHWGGYPNGRDRYLPFHSLWSLHENNTGNRMPRSRCKRPLRDLVMPEDGEEAAQILEDIQTLGVLLADS